jgi:hypothetical protein
LSTPLCVYVKFNGVQCGSPPLRGKVLCYHHARSRTARQSNIVIPTPDSPEAVTYTHHALLQLMLNKKITAGEYRSAVYGLHMTILAMKMSEKCAQQARVTDVSRHVSTDIAFAGPDADPIEKPIVVGARLASPAAELESRDLVLPRSAVGAEPEPINLEPPVELQPNSRTPTALGASVSHSALADPIDLDPMTPLVENAKLTPRPALPPEFKFPQRPLTQEELDDPYVRPTTDALADYLNREYLKRRRMFG